MSELRLSLLIAGGGILCLLIQLVVSLTDSPGRRAQLTAQKVAFESVHLRADKRVPYGRVAELIGIVQQGGLTRIGFVAVAPAVSR